MDMYNGVVRVYFGDVCDDDVVEEVGVSFDSKASLEAFILGIKDLVRSTEGARL